MVNSKHTTTVEIVADVAQADRAIDRLQQKIDALNQSVNLDSGGGGGGTAYGGSDPGGSSGAFAALENAVGKLDRAAEKLLQAADKMAQNVSGSGGGGAGGGGAGGGGGRGGRDTRGVRAMDFAGGLATAGATSPGGIMTGLGAGVGRIGASIPIAGAALAGLGLTLGFAGQAMNQQFNAAQGRAGLERVGVRGAGLSGALGVDAALGMAGTGGMTAGDILSQRVAFQMAMGRASAQAGETVPGTSRMLALSLGAGVGAGTMGAVAGVATGRGGARNVDVERSIQLGVEAGFKGAKLEQFLSEMVGAVDSLQRQGLPINVDSVEDIRAGMIATGMQSTSINPFVTTGMGMIGNARSQLLAPFQQLGQQAIFAEALRGGGGFRGALGRIEGMANDPSTAFGGRGSAISKFAGPMADLVFASMNLNAADAETMAQTDIALKGIGRRGKAVTMPGGTATAAAMAKFEAEQIRQLQPTDVEDFTKTMLELQVAINGFADVGVSLTKAITGPLASTTSGVSKALEKLTKLLQGKRGSFRGSGASGSF